MAGQSRSGSGLGTEGRCRQADPGFTSHPCTRMVQWPTSERPGRGNDHVNRTDSAGQALTSRPGSCISGAVPAGRGRAAVVLVLLAGATRHRVCRPEPHHDTVADGANAGANAIGLFDTQPRRNGHGTGSTASRRHDVRGRTDLCEHASIRNAGLGRAGAGHHHQRPARVAGRNYLGRPVSPGLPLAIAPGGSRAHAVDHW